MRKRVRAFILLMVVTVLSLCSAFSSFAYREQSGSSSPRVNVDNWDDDFNDWLGTKPYTWQNPKLYGGQYFADDKLYTSSSGSWHINANYAFYFMSKNSDLWATVIGPDGTRRFWGMLPAYYRGNDIVVKIKHGANVSGTLLNGGKEGQYRNGGYSGLSDFEASGHRISFNVTEKDAWIKMYMYASGADSTFDATVYFDVYCSGLGDWISYGDKHGKICPECGDVCDLEPHEDGDGDGTCDVCNGSMCDHSGDDGTQYKYSDDAHHHVCSVCGADYGAPELHNYVKKYYEENGVKDAYYILTCVCGKPETGNKVYEKTTVHYDMNGGEANIPDKQVDRGKAYKVSATMPERVGYTFTGWSTTKNGAVQFQGDDIAYPGGTIYTLYACWEARKFQIYFDKGPSSQPITVTYGQPIGQLPDSGTSGWCEEITRQPVDSTTIYTFNESITLIPRDDTEYINITFISDSESVTFQAEKGAVVAPPFTPTPASGFTFKWWSDTRGGSEFDFSTEIYQDMTFYAVIEGNKITVTLLGNGTREYNYGANIGDLPSASQQGAEFKGWYWDQDCTQPVSPDELVPAYDVVLYPKFDLIKFKIDLGEYGEFDISQYDHVPALPQPEKEGQTFLGWFTPDNQEIKEGDEYIWNYAIQLRPKFSTTQWVVSLPNGETRLVYDGDTIGQIPTGSVSAGTRVIGFQDSKGNVVDSDTVVRGNMVIKTIIERNRLTLTLMDGENQHSVRDVDAGLRITDLPVLSKAGYTFRGWSQGDGGVVTTGPFYSDCKLYAVYSADKQTIVLGELNQTVEKATGTQIGSLPVPSKEGYEFDGWLWNGNKVTADTIVPAGGMTLTPSWTKIEVDTTRYVTIRYWSDGIRINTVDMNPGEILYDPGAPALNDLKVRTFAYWKDSTGRQYVFGKRISADLDLYAVWN